MGALFKRKRRLYRVLGAKDEGRARILYRFAEWNTCGRVASWEILRFLHGAEEAVAVWQFGGVSLVRFDADGRIRFLHSAAMPIAMIPMPTALCPCFGTKRCAGFEFLAIKKPGCNPVLLRLIAVPYAAAHGA